MNLRPLTDEALLARLEALVRQERENIGDIVEHLAEVDHREIVVDRGFSTLFDYCVKKLRYSEAGAFLRIRAARAVIAFPRILADLKTGAIHLDSVMRLYPHLNEQNSEKLLDQAAGSSKREVLALVARLETASCAPERDVIRPLPPSPSAPAASPVVVAPPSRVRLSFTADDDFLVLVERLRSLRRNKFPAGRLEDILKEAVTMLLERIDPDRRAARRKTSGFPPASPVSAGRGSRRVPAAVKDEVWKRDGGRCGRSDRAGNIRLLCRPHNQRLARRRFGPRRRILDRALLRPDAVEHGPFKSTP